MEHCPRGHFALRVGLTSQEGSGPGTWKSHLSRHLSAAEEQTIGPERLRERDPVIHLSRDHPCRLTESRWCQRQTRT
ncbi:hypothetical protein NDU88_004887 [Pleurodeles waltl]|uniref:Uncharacterized protein n=1 Tax=Pleurodeles waltl TaxID=8319 RepID=A0AAV7LJG1_PLEWA|nr:hypothetical protein NDU88_004887 [Pleurodeles waltl]